MRNQWKHRSGAPRGILEELLSRGTLTLVRGRGRNAGLVGGGGGAPHAARPRRRRLERRARALLALVARVVGPEAELELELHRAHALLLRHLALQLLVPPLQRAQVVLRVRELLRAAHRRVEQERETMAEIKD